MKILTFWVSRSMKYAMKTALILLTYTTRLHMTLRNGNTYFKILMVGFNKSIGALKKKSESGRRPNASIPIHRKAFSTPNT